MFRLLRSIILIAVGASSLHSWELAAQSPNEEIRQLSFSTLSWGRSIRDLYYQNASGDPIALRIPNGAPSSALEYRGTFPVHFFRIAGEDETGAPIKELAATLEPSSNDPQLLLFVGDSRAQSATYRILSVPYSGATAPENEYRFLNLSQFPVYVKFGTNQFKIESNSEESVLTEIPEDGGQQIAMAIQVSEEPADVKIAYSSSWSVREGRSALVFITRELDADDAIDVRTFYY